MLVRNKVNALLARLDFDKSTVVQKADELKEVIAEAEKFILENTDENINAEYSQLYYKLGLVALFKNRDQKKSASFLKPYLAIIEQTAPHSFEHAEALNLLGHTHTIDGAYQSAELFSKAIEILLTLERNNNTDEQQKQIQSEFAFAYRYTGLMFHRKSMKEATEENFKTAQSNFDLSAEMYKTLAAGKACIQQAESIHLKGASLSQQKKYKKSLATLDQAYTLEKAYIKLTDKPHFMRYTTLQNLGDTKRKRAVKIKAAKPTVANQLLEQASEHLQKAEKGQRALFEKLNADFAKTLQFAGDVFMERGMYSEATNKYLEALELKIKLFGPNHGLVKWTNESLDELHIKISALGNVSGQANFLYAHAKCLMKVKENVSALSKLDEAFKLLRASPTDNAALAQEIKNEAEKLRAVLSPASQSRFAIFALKTETAVVPVQESLNTLKLG